MQPQGKGKIGAETANDQDERLPLEMVSAQCGTQPAATDDNDDNDDDDNIFNLFHRS